MSRLSKNIMYNLLGQGLLLILGFVAVRFIFRRLGEDALGIIYFAAVLNAILCAVLEMGICSTTVREVSAHFESDPAYIKDVIRTFSLLYWALYALLATAIFLFAPFLVKSWITLKAMDPATATRVLRVLGIASLVALPKSFYVSLFRGLQRMEFNNVIDVTVSGLQQFGTIFILVCGGSVFHVVYWFAACYGLSILAYFSLSARFFSLRALVPGCSFNVIKRNLSFASRMMSVSIISTIHSNFDKLIISKLLPIGTVGYYGIAYAGASKGLLLAGAVSQAAFPSFSALFRAGEQNRLVKQYWKLHDLLCLGIAPILAIVPFALLPLFSYVFNAETARRLLVPTIFLCVGFYLNGTVYVPHVFSLAVGRPGIAARANFYALFVVLPLTALLIYFFGLEGAGLSLVSYHIFGYCYGVPRICRECLKISVWRWYAHVLRIFILIGLSYGVAGVFLATVGFASIVSLLLAYSLASIVFTAGSYFIMREELRETLSAHLNRFRAQVAGVLRVLAQAQA
jgi:O-antigen/teichoic acid export membrane protein